MGISIKKNIIRHRKILGLIPARGGSKGLPCKNIYPINGKPLIAYTIDASLKSKFISDTVVSSEDDEIRQVAKKYGANVINRPYKYATDNATSESVVFDAIKQLKKNGNEYDIIVLLQPTSPLRDEDDIDKAIEKMLKSEADALISVTNIGVKPFKSYYLNDKGYMQGVHNNKTPNMRRQDLPDAFSANGAIYIIYTKTFFKTKSLMTSNTIPYIMNKKQSYDIDTIEDINNIELIMTKQ